MHTVAHWYKTQPTRGYPLQTCCCRPLQACYCTKLTLSLPGDLQQHALGWLDTDLGESVLMLNGQDYGLHQLLNLLIKATNV